MSNLNNSIQNLNSYYLIILILVIIFTSSIYLINFFNINEKDKQNKNINNTESIVERYSPFFIPLVTLMSFFIACFSYQNY